MASVEGTYIYEKPGSGEKETKNLTLKSDKTVTFSVTGDNRIETYTINGEGTWYISQDGEHVECRFPKITKVNTPKAQQLVTYDPVHVTEDDGLDFLVADLVNAPAASSFAKHKWKRC